MGVNKNYLGRLQAIHERLSTGLQYSKEELLDAVESRTGTRPSEKTLYNDLRALKDEYGAPIPDRKRSGKPYCYTDAFSLFGLLNPTDATLANEAVALIRQMNTLPQFAGLDEILLKFEQQPGVIGRVKESVVQFEQNKQYVGLKWLPEFYKAIQDNQPLLIGYTEFDKLPEQFTLSPYLLKEYNNRWHVYGWANERSGMVNIALDRVDSVRILSDLQRRPDITNWDDYLANVVGFTRYASEPLETWVLRVWFPRAHYVATKPLHGSQQVRNRTEEYLDFQYELHWNRELDARILELGPDAELISPAFRRAELAKKVQIMIGRYGYGKVGGVI